jgi:hypothetical protein
MPRNKLSNADLVKQFGEEVFEFHKNVILCKVCSKTFNSPVKCQLDQHVGTLKHKEALRRQRDHQSQMQQQLTEALNVKPGKNINKYIFQRYV